MDNEEKVASSKNTSPIQDECKNYTIFITKTAEIFGAENTYIAFTREGVTSPSPPPSLRDSALRL